MTVNEFRILTNFEYSCRPTMAKDPDINPTLLIYYCDLTSKAGTAIHYYRSHTMDLTTINLHNF